MSELPIPVVYPGLEPSPSQGSVSTLTFVRVIAYEQLRKLRNATYQLAPRLSSLSEGDCFRHGMDPTPHRAERRSNG